MPTTYTPALTSLTNFRVRVQLYLNLGNLSDTDLNTATDAAVNGAIARINTRNWRKIVGNASITVAADDADYLFSAISANDFRDPRALIRLNSSSERDGRIDFVDEQTFYTEFPQATSSGSPTHYTIQYEERAVLLNVPPNSAFASNYPTLDFRFYRRVDELSAGGDTIDIPPDFDHFLTWHARAELAEIMGNDRKADRAWQQAETRWIELKRDDTDILTDWDMTV